MSFSKIQVIKMLRNEIPGLGLKEAKDIVDSYEVQDFETRVARALGEEAREELRRWAWLYTSMSNRKVDQLPAVTVPEAVTVPDYDYSCCADCDDTSYDEPF